MATLLRNHLVFQATFPTEGGWVGDQPDHKNPPGRKLSEFLLSLLSPSSPASKIWNEEGYGWAFNCRRESVAVYVLVQRLEHWLVIADAVSFRPRFLRGPHFRQAVESVCSSIENAASLDPRFSGFRRLTLHEYSTFERAEAHRSWRSL